ncbi:MAG TPA: dTDP-glucose 4,6-dehydratase [Polyangia bacterium]|nr:dTDP-glucose 4,6-dehydratase [Polyangia bacterium]
MSLLVTGGAGFIGSNFVRLRRASRPSEKLVVLDALTYAGNRHNLDGLELEFVRGDICDVALVEATLRDFAVDAIVHFAAETHVDRSISGPAPFISTNVLGTATLLDRARAAGVRRFVHVSTDEVYGELGPDDPPFSERTPLAPRSPYSASKAGSDHLVRAWFETYKFPTLITRCSNNYGPYQFPEKLIPLMILNALAGVPLPVYGDGLNVRDWIHVEDHCAAVERVLEAGRDGEVYNIGGRAERANLEIVRAILRELDRPESLIQFVTDRLGHDRRYAIDCAKIERELGWSPTRKLESGLQETIRWYREHEAWWRRIRSGEYRA